MLNKLAPIQLHLQSSLSASKRRGQFRVALLSLLACSLLVQVISSASPAEAVAFSSPFFRSYWQRADYPVVIGATQRGFTWGPEPFNSTFEPYAESPNGQRRVEYFDKARMEISRPDLNPNTAYYVTNGLIVKEMVTGMLQAGDNQFSQRLPAYDVPVAGDPGPGNSEGVTYASFFALNTFYNTFSGPDALSVGPGILDRQPNRINERASDTISKGGALGRNDLLGGLNGLEYVYYDRTLGHNIPKVFNDYLNQSGQIFDGRGIVFGRVFDWVGTMGYPITDAYWTRAVVAGVAKDVLVQLYERRVLTYTPTNPDPFKVEMGNVGRHYYSWRYNALYDLGLPLQVNATVKPEAGFPGTTFSIRAFNFIQNEDISTVITTPDGKAFTGETLVGSFENPSGYIYFTVYLKTSPLTKPGQYTVYFQGLTSGNEAKAYFFVVGIPGFNLPPR